MLVIRSSKVACRIPISRERGDAGLVPYNLRVGTTDLNLRARLQRFFLYTILSLIGAAVLAFVVDFLVFRLRVAANWSPYGSVTVSHYYAVAQKNGKTQFIFDPPQPWTCVHALFPRDGSLPCWYLDHHPEQRTDI